MNEVIFTTSWDDGHPLDLKLAELLRRYSIPATFYTPINNPERECMNPGEIRGIAQEFDIGGHSYNHVKLTHMSPDEAKREITSGKERLEEIIGRNLTAFCYPWGKFNGRIAAILREVGFTGARTVKLFTRNLRDPFMVGTMVYAGDLWSPAYIKHAMASLDSALSLFLLRNNLFFRQWDKIAIETLRFVIENGGVWHLWGHSWEIDENNDWEKLEAVLMEVGQLGGGMQKADNSQLIGMCFDNGSRG